jgi:hypothetical protein
MDCKCGSNLTEFCAGTLYLMVESCTHIRKKCLRRHVETPQHFFEIDAHSSLMMLQWGSAFTILAFYWQ